MTSEKLLEALGSMDDRFIEESAPVKKKTSKKRIAVLVAAACLILAVAIPLTVITLTNAWDGVTGAAPYSAFVVWNGAYACLEDSTYINTPQTVLRIDNDTRRVQVIEKNWDGMYALYAGPDGLYSLIQPHDTGLLGLYRLDNYGSCTLVNDLSSLPNRQISNYQICGDAFTVQIGQDIYCGKPDGELTRIFERGEYASLSLWNTTPNWVFAVAGEGNGIVHVLGYEIAGARAMELYITAAANLVWISECNGAIYWNNLRDGFYCMKDADSDPVLLKASEEMPVGAGIYDDRYMYLYSDKSEDPAEHGLYIYDLNCNLLSFLPAPEEAMLSYAFSTETDVYFYRFSGGYPDTRAISPSSVPVYYIEKALIGTDGLGWNAVDTSYQRQIPFN